MIIDNKNLIEFGRLVVSQALCFVNRDNINDLIQTGWLGLLKARKNYKPERGDFEPYAKKCIVNELKRSALSQNELSKREWFVESENICWYIPDSIDGDEAVLLQMKLDGYTYEEISERLGITKTMCQILFKKICRTIRENNEEDITL